jgi:hypothetical protein
MGARNSNIVFYTGHDVTNFSVLICSSPLTGTRQKAELVGDSLPGDDDDIGGAEDTEEEFRRCLLLREVGVAKWDVDPRPGSGMVRVEVAACGT